MDCKSHCACSDRIGRYHSIEYSSDKCCSVKLARSPNIMMSKHSTTIIIQIHSPYRIQTGWRILTRAIEYASGKDELSVLQVTRALSHSSVGANTKALYTRQTQSSDDQSIQVAVLRRMLSVAHQPAALVASVHSMCDSYTRIHVHTRTPHQTLNTPRAYLYIDIIHQTLTCNKNTDNNDHQ